MSLSRCPDTNKFSNSAAAVRNITSYTLMDRSIAARELAFHASHGSEPSMPAERIHHLPSQPDMSCANAMRNAHPCKNARMGHPRFAVAHTRPNLSHKGCATRPNTKPDLSGPPMNAPVLKSVSKGLLIRD